mmetsp:Transcript_68362/g.111001  ORF Transcript_68362/g.111001 Transcript_68362/m.111001 type:complete len:386 (-) Transcript_68362:84-1241(-)
MSEEETPCDGTKDELAEMPGTPEAGTASFLANPNEFTSVADVISIVRVPWERRLQTAAVASFVFALPFTMACMLVSGLLLMNPFTTFPMLIYLVVIYNDTAQHTGKRRSEWVRGWKWWKHFAAYFPMSLRSDAKLNPDDKFVFGYHPHGIISVGALATFGTDGLDFSGVFPGIDVHLVTLPTNFRVPFLREIWLSLGICDSSKKTFKSILSRGSGSAIAVVVGGAAESLESAPGTMELTLCNRRGFVRQAILYGACLVPVVGFGETDVFQTTQMPAIKSIQERLQKYMGFAVPIFHGRGVFNKAFGLLPFRRSVHVVVGTPVDPAKLSPLAKLAAEKGEGWLCKDEQGVKLVELVHDAYMEELQKVYDRHKNVCYPMRVKSMVIN